MTRLYVLRHAKAAAALPAMRDFDRPLDSAGIKASDNLGASLAHLGHVPHAIICSPSLRTRQTLEKIEHHFSMPIPTSFDQQLFTEEWPEYLQIIRQQQNCQTLMIIGHNPSCEDIVHQLVGSGEKRALRQLLDGFAPGTLAVIKFEVPFDQIQPRMGYLETILLDGCTTR